MTEHLKDYYKEQAKKYLSIEITVTTLHPLNKIYMQTELDFYIVSFFQIGFIELKPVNFNYPNVNIRKIFFFYFFYLKKFENFVI